MLQESEFLFTCATCSVLRKQTLPSQISGTPMHQGKLRDLTLQLGDVNLQLQREGDTQVLSQHKEGPQTDGAETERLGDLLAGTNNCPALSIGGEYNFLRLRDHTARRKNCGRLQLKRASSNPLTNLINHGFDRYHDSVKARNDFQESSTARRRVCHEAYC